MHKVALLLLLMAIAALMEMATLVSIVPLVASLMDTPDAASKSFSRYLPQFVLQSENPNAIILGAVVVVVCISALFRILVTRLSSEFAARVGVMLQRRYFNIIINAEYEDIVNEPSSRKINIITTSIPYIVSTYVLNALSLTTSLISATGIVVMLVWFSTGVIFLALLVLTLVYVLVAYYSRRRLRRYGQSVATNNPKKVGYLQDSLGGIRDVIMGSSQRVFAEHFTSAAEKVEIAKARLVFYAAFPRPVLEAIGISAIAAIAYYINRGSIDGRSVLPVLGAFSLGLLRLLPYLQKIFSQWSAMYHGQQMLVEVMQAINMDDKPQLSLTTETSKVMALSFEEEIKLDNVGFNYRDVTEPVLQGASIEIKKGEFVGIVGQTGSGKSTLVDIIMGLLPPTQGQLKVDGQVIDDMSRGLWRQKVTHVPQRIYLSEGSIMSNIAFSVPEDEIDIARVKQCAARAHVDAYIESLALSYRTNVGENGVRLSGGQRQRIGIARALYAQCEVMVFDEATNAVDAQTEKAIINELKNIGDNITVISVAHNDEAVRHCDHIYQVGDGVITRAEVS